MGGPRRVGGVAQPEGEKTDVAGVMGDIVSSSESDSVADDVVEADRIRFIGVAEA